ncbi:MAG: pentapeptide repeat-containing protein, partial [Cyanobacteria bacterium P01_A01_bin.83]
PWLTLITIAVVLIPIPSLITSQIYQQGRYHQLLDQSYLVENGAFREFQILLGRLPIMPRFPFFRDRYMPILWSKRWNWLNYYNFSFNNIFKIGFLDIRVRDQHLPGLISTLVWYQWSLGVIYIILLLWTLSRTIPGLNLLIYF